MTKKIDPSEVVAVIPCPQCGYPVEYDKDTRLSDPACPVCNEDAGTEEMMWWESEINPDLPF